ncbi:ATP-binding cassette transporter ABC4 [Pseudovirgaria hyperparasitica]|uniref:ATP-binding cassette transporter ABC4 n=1 Tax=Pseudovirgaria hyperparasitica TaxID=470096 RepID=A0A6A6W1Y8_9PEZI|nr:ATP-binding cassette transporter ABC4 [Pseudovirgaria hyperparasitica]KAF2756024.1 ATP-binding cassette transporter ABC4 [Pseudovirgaria hyperparasitica]
MSAPDKNTIDRHSSDSSQHVVQDQEKVAAAQAPMPVEGVPADGMQTLDLSKADSSVVKPIDSETEDALEKLPVDEQHVLRRQLVTPDVKVTYFTLYRYATRMDLIILSIAAFCAIAAGALMPLMTVIFGQLAGTFQGFFQGTTPVSAFQDSLSTYTLYFVYLSIGEFILTYIYTVGYLYTGEHMSGKVREAYLAAILRQNIGYFDKLGAGEITTRITADSNLVQEGMSEKVGLTLNAIATFVAAFVIGFVKYWKLTLILTSVVVAIVTVMGAGSTFILKYNKQSLSSYAAGGTIAEEVLSSIRNASAFGTQDKLAKQYDEHLGVAEKWARKMSITLACMLGSMMCIIYLNYGLSFWQGSRFLVAGEMNLSSVITILLAIMIGAFSLGNVGPWIKSFSTATAAAAKIFSTIDRVSPIDGTLNEGLIPESVEGTVELRNIKHIYPSRPEVVVMEDVSLMVPAGKTTALVGASGSGKSTIVGLVERFYDPVGGEVYLDGINMKDLNVRWLRRQVALVQQEPVLFATTVFKNIKHGLIGTEHEHLDDEKVTELVHDAAKMCNAHDFITALPEGYETNVGERGFLMSGGQKQRIAIARAVVSNPRILLLDEATSALDTKSEGVVQAALDKAAEGRTTIVIAHRLSTIKNADNIVVMSRGRIVEQGLHDDLLEKKNAYYNLVEAQRIAAKTETELTEEEEDSASSTDEKEKIELNLSRSRSKSRGYEEAEEDVALRLKKSKSAMSQSEIALQKRPGDKEQTYSLWTIIKFIWSFNRSEWHLMAFGLVMAAIAGGGNPVQAVFFSKAIVSLSYPPNQYDQLRSDVNFWAAMYLMLAFVMFLSWTLNMSTFGYCSEKLIHRVRDKAFRTMLRQDIGYFDREENTAGALTSTLSTQTTSLAGLSGATLGTILNSVSTLIGAFALSLAIAWKLAIVCIATVPVLLACGFFRFWLLARFEHRSKKVYEKSASFACEATAAIRTVASLTREQDVWDQYHEQIVDQGRRSLRSVLKSSVLYALSQSLIFCCTALGFWWGGTLLARGELGLFQFFVCFSSVIFGSQSAGTVFSFAPDMGKAKHAATELLNLFNRVPSIDTWSNDGEEVQTMEGSIEFRDVHFRYPTRPEQPVLRGLDLTVKPGQYVALVGASGCGKSTTIAMLERFYDPLAGGVYVDGKEISSLNINQYRSFLALVSQEPTLYQGTVRENILLGGDREDITDEQIEKACKNANIYDFIMSLPEGFNTVCGNKGALLSGGQKQRVAIARALIRDPKILLLDEATSALDSESEKVVQAALDAAAKGRTTIAVAHRLSTIQKADVIYVFDAGRIVEKGTHQELISRKGKYFELVSLQSLEKMH